MSLYRENAYDGDADTGSALTFHQKRDCILDIIGDLDRLSWTLDGDVIQRVSAFVDGAKITISEYDSVLIKPKSGGKESYLGKCKKGTFEKIRQKCKYPEAEEAVDTIFGFIRRL